MNMDNYPLVVGVFRERSKAEQAITKLKRIGIGENQIELTEYKPQNEQETDSSSQNEMYKRLIVKVETDGMQQEAVGVMMNNGANNSDIPPGTTLVDGSLVSTNAANADLNSGQPTNESSPESFFGKNARDTYIP